MADGPSLSGAERRRLRVTGTVQGVGFRPFVYRHAVSLGLVGFVRNDTDGVLIEVEGDPAAVGELCRLVREEPPPLARVESVHAEVVRRLVRRSGASVSWRARARCAGGAGERRQRHVRRRAWPRWTTRATVDTGTRSPTAPTAVLATPSWSPSPTTGPPRPWPGSRCARRARRSTTTRPTAASTPNPTPAPTAGPRCARAIPRAVDSPRGTGRWRAPSRRSWPGHRRRQGDRRLPPGRRRPRGGRGPSPAAQGPRRQAVRRDGARRGPGAITVPPERRRRGGPVLPPPPRRAGGSADRRPLGSGGGTGAPRTRPAALLHPPAPPAHGGGAAPAGHDQREPVGRPHRLRGGRRRGAPGPPGGRRARATTAPSTSGATTRCVRAAGDARADGAPVARLRP